MGQFVKRFLFLLIIEAHSRVCIKNYSEIESLRERVVGIKRIYLSFQRYIQICSIIHENSKNLFFLQKKKNCLLNRTNNRNRFLRLRTSNLKKKKKKKKKKVPGVDPLV